SSCSNVYETNAIKLHALINYLQDTLGNPPDLNKYPFSLSHGIEGYCIFIETLIDKKKIENDILPIFTEKQLYDDLIASENVIQSLSKRIPAISITASADIDSCIQELLAGKSLLTIAGINEILIIDVAKFNHRPVSEPQTETTVRGPREAFNEDFAINIGLLRKRIRSTKLHIEQMTIGTRTETRLLLAFMKDLAPSEVVNEFRRRIQLIQTDSLLDTTYVEEWIQDSTFSFFPTLLNTERPDVTASHILEGRVAVLVDGSPIAIIGPITLFQYFSAPEDYYQRANVATLLRWLRIWAFTLAVFVPALYIAVISYHQALIPPSLLINISAQREGVPFSGALEAFIMMITFEILREAGLRMPRVAGQAISIVGALVLGQAAVQAGLVSAAMVIIVSITAISNFVSPFYNFAISQRLLQFSYMLLASFMGLFGILCGVLFTTVHLASLKSFGVPYLAPLAPTLLSDWKDTLIRVPRQWMTTFPRMNDIKYKKKGKLP
ncbi:MAG: spore germination protein, partial [Paenibacillus sp.]|nr:spore germination protein [Paenibacillus sp.]